MKAIGAPIANPGYTAVWTGTEMIVWGAVTSDSKHKAGGRYNPAADAWTLTSTEGMPNGNRSGHTAVWTGSGMMIFGGTESPGTFPDNTYFYSLTKPMYLYKKP